MSGTEIVINRWWRFWRRTLRLLKQDSHLSWDEEERKGTVYTTICFSELSICEQHTNKGKNIHRRGVQKSLKRYLFTCWSCFYKELLIAVFLKRTFLFSLLFLSWNKWKTNILQGQNIISCLVVSACNLSSVIMNYLYIYIYILNVNLVFYNFNYIYKDYACISFTVIIIMNTIFKK